MTGCVERHGKTWVIRQSILHEGRSLDSYWSGLDWIEDKEKAEHFKTKAIAKARASSVPPLELKQVRYAPSIPVGWDDSHALSSLLSRAQILVQRGLFQNAPHAEELIRAIQNSDPNRAELSQRLRDLCEAAEARSLAEGLFSRIMSREASQRASDISAMVKSNPPTFEEEWLEFKSGSMGRADVQRNSRPSH
jgi:hypothetical protein